jgi:hypothetical protein
MKPDPATPTRPYTVKTISVAYERKINLGDYNSAHLGVTLWAEPDEGADPDEVARLLQAEARDLCREEYKRLDLAAPKRRGNGTLDPSRS